MEKAKYASLEAVAEAIKKGEVPKGHAYVWLDKNEISIKAREGGLSGEGQGVLLYKADEDDFVIEALALLGIEADHV